MADGPTAPTRRTTTPSCKGRAWAWELRLQDEIGPAFRIEEEPYRAFPYAGIALQVDETRQGDRSQNPEDDDHDDQFDQREATLTR